MMIRNPEMKKRASVAAALILLLSGCMIGPDYRRPAVTTPDVFRGASAAIPPDKQSIAELKWFEVFQDEQLQELIRTALQQNYDLRDAVARVDAARANLGITQADQYPNFGIGADVSSVEQSRQGQFTIPRGTSRQRTFGSVFLNLFTFEIDIWGRLRRATEASRADLLSADWTRKAVLTTLISDVATAYFSLLEFDMELEIAKNTLATRAESLRLIRLQLQGGVGTLLDVRQGEQLVYGAAQSIPDTERQIEQMSSVIKARRCRIYSRVHEEYGVSSLRLPSRSSPADGSPPASTWLKRSSVARWRNTKGPFNQDFATSRMHWSSSNALKRSARSGSCWSPRCKTESAWLT